MSEHNHQHDEDVIEDEQEQQQGEHHPPMPTSNKQVILVAFIGIIFLIFAAIYFSHSGLLR